MKISKVQTFVVDFFRANLVFVRIDTDEGLHGWGEATIEFNDEAVDAAINRAAADLLGRNPFEIVRLIDELHRNSYFRTGVILRSALSGIEAALMDIKGKALGVPVFELLGGQVRDKIPCYANAWFAGAKTADEFASKAKVAVTSGYRALKWDPFGSAWRDLSKAELIRAIEIVEAVHASVPRDVDLLIEGHGRFNVATALRVARSLEAFAPLFFEEPIPPDSIAAYGELRRISPVPIATGERHYDPSTFHALIEAQAADWLQPDVCHVGGLEAVKAVASIAEARFIPIAPHNPMGPVANAMNLHLAAALPAVSILEMMMSDVAWRADIASETMRIEKGQAIISGRPGLGVDVNVEACLAHPPKPHRLRHFDGRLTEIRPPEMMHVGG